MIFKSLFLEYLVPMCLDLVNIYLLFSFINHLLKVTTTAPFTTLYEKQLCRFHLNVKHTNINLQNVQHATMQFQAKLISYSVTQPSSHPSIRLS